jgi:hypothetical protein
MKIHWRWRDIPELAGLSRSEQRKVVRDCFFRFGFRLWQFWAALAAMLVFAVSGKVAGLLLWDRFGLPEAVAYACTLAGVLIGCLIYYLVYFGVLMDRLRPHFRAASQCSRVTS